MSGEIVCTCDALDTASPAHEVTCPMVTGVPVGMGEWQELASPEPPLARVLRARVEDRRVVQVSLIDGSTIAATVVEVSEDGCVAELDDGGHEIHTIDVAAVTVISMRKSQIEPRS